MSGIAAKALGTLLQGSRLELIAASGAPVSPPTKGLVFYHVPKCAGMMATYALKWALRILCLDQPYFCDRAELSPLIRPLSAYAGLASPQPVLFAATHNAFGFHRMAPNPVTTMTILRHPRDRLVSHYCYGCMRQAEAPTHRGFLTFLDDPANRNITTRMFSGDGEAVGKDSVERAVTTLLDQVDHVVTVDGTAALLSHLLALYGTPNVVIGRVNKTMADYRLDLTGADLPEDMEALDRAVYDRVAPNVANRALPVPTGEQTLNRRTIVIEEKQRVSGSMEAAYLLDTADVAEIAGRHPEEAPFAVFRERALRVFMPQGFAEY